MTHPFGHDSEQHFWGAMALPEDPFQLLPPTWPLAGFSAEPPSASELLGSDRSILIAEQRRVLSHLLLQASSFPARSRAHALAPCTYTVPPMARRHWMQRAIRFLAWVAEDSACAQAAGPHLVLETQEGQAVLLLRQLLLRRLGQWPGAVSLVQAARSLNDSTQAAMALAVAHLLEGDAARALFCFGDLQRSAPRDPFASQVFEGLAYGHLLRQDLRAAQAAMERAAELPGAQVSALAWSLYLNLARGDALRSERAAARLDLLVAGTSIALVVCLERMRARTSGRHGPQDFEFPTWERARLASNRLMRWARERRSPSGRVARALGAFP